MFAIAGNDTIHRLVSSAPGSRSLVERFVAGETAAEAVATVKRLADDGLCSTLDHVGEEVPGRTGAERSVQEYLKVLDAVYAEELSECVEVSVTLAAIGGSFDEKLAFDNLWRICAAAEQCATTVTLDAEPSVVSELRRTWPSAGAVLRSAETGIDAEAAALAMDGSRVRLSDGVPSHKANLSYVRGVNILLAGDGHPIFATTDRRLIEIIEERALWHGCKQGEYEFQLPYGVRADEQLRLAQDGETVRVHAPFGTTSLRTLASRS
jgi:proline dehydrogenase